MTLISPPKQLEKKIKQKKKKKTLEGDGSLPDGTNESCELENMASEKPLPLQIFFFFFFVFLL